MPLTGSTGWRITRAALMMCLITTATASSGGEIRGWDEDFGDLFFAAIPDIDAGTGTTSVPSEFGDCPPSPKTGTEANTLFAPSDPIGFIPGITFIDDRLYIVEWDARRMARSGWQPSRRARAPAVPRPST